MSAYDNVVRALEDAGQEVEQREPGVSQATCPAHPDEKPSLSIREAEGKVLLHCHAGCETRKIIRALKLSWTDLNETPRVVATYDYVDEKGSLLYQKLRYEPKDFRTRAPDGTGWTWKLQGVRQVLYRLPQVLKAVEAGQTVWIAEGEKDADALVNVGATATSSKGWRPEFAETFRNTEVTVIQDNDAHDAGEKTARRVVDSLTDVARAVRLVKAKTGKDAYDHLAAGLGLADFVRIKTSRLTRLSEIQERPTQWLVKDLLPLGELAILAGMEGVGKSTIAYTLAARVSTGKADGFYKGQPQGVILVCTEDRFDSTIKPRILAADGDIDKIYRYDNPEKLYFPEGADDLRAVVKESGAALVVLDPLTSRVSSSLDTYKDSGIRQALEPVAKIAHDHDCSILGLMHINKSGARDSRNALIAGRGFSALARSVLWCVEYGEDEWLFGADKSNLTGQHYAMRYAIRTEALDGGMTTSRIDWLGPAQVRIRDVFGGRA